MNKLLRRVLSREDYKKVMLIKKYAKIRFKRFWNEWGFSKEDVELFFGALSVLVFIFSMYIIGCMF